MSFKASPDFAVSNSPRISASIPRRKQGRRRLLAAALLLGLPLVAQTPGASADGPFAQSPVGGSIEAKMEARRIGMLNLIRQKNMVSDADKLLRLAQELNEDADAGGTKMSPTERMHKAAEIEKLAKAVKEKMTYAIGAPESLSGPF